MKHSPLTTLLLALVLGLTTSHAVGKLGEWKRLGQKEAGLRVDHDQIAVGIHEGAFKAIKLEVRNAGVDFIHVRVVYATGSDQNLEVRSNVRAGGQTRALDLDGRHRSLRKVVFTYRADRKTLKRPVVVLYGRR